MKTSALVMLFMVGVSGVGTGIAAPLPDLATASLRNTHATKGFGGFALRGDGADYRLGRRVGLFVDYQEMRPANGVFSSLQTGLPAMPPVRLGNVVVRAGVRVLIK